MRELRVLRDDLATCEVVEATAEAEDLQEGQARLRIDRFALSANNVTYAALGDQLGYWGVFPAPEPWGRVPAWGYARAVASRSPAIAEGQKVFGLVPMASDVVVLPTPHPLGFVEASSHRAGLAPVYNQYLWMTEEGDDTQLVMRPLFGTSVMLDLKLSNNGLYGAQTVVVTSASSKTAYGVAYLLRERPVETIGLTSPSRHAWVDGLRLYDAVLTYDDIDDLDPSGDVLLIDFAGDASLVRRLHERLSGALVRSISVGFTHWKCQGDEAPLPGPAPEFFFAPDEMTGRGRELAQRYVETWQGFASVLDRSLRIERIADGGELKRVYYELANGSVDPALGFVVSL